MVTVVDEGNRHVSFVLCRFIYLLCANVIGYGRYYVVTSYDGMRYHRDTRDCKQSLSSEHKM